MKSLFICVQKEILYFFTFRRNEEIDKNMVIRRLQTTLAKLHLELAHYKVGHLLFAGVYGVMLS